MRKLALLLFALHMVVSADAASRRVTVEQLQQLVASNRGKPDAKVAQLLSSLELAERLNGDKLAQWQTGQPGPESRRALVLLADLSAFLDPPAGEIPATATPDLATQRALIASAVDYATRAMHQLPNFLATRDTIRFEDSPPSQRADSSFIPYKPLHAVERLSATVVYRDGREEDSAAKKADQSQPSQGLITSGEFGPILGVVLVDAAQGKLAWGHWEKGTRGPVAIFRFVVPREDSHYEVKFCCVVGESIDGVVARKTGYHGEMAVDPASGSILRLTLKADLSKTDKIVRADILVQYGPVNIGDQTYVCPVKSISISVAPASPLELLDLRHNSFAAEALQGDRNPGLQTKLNDVAFDQYHVFRAEARVLTNNAAASAGPSGPGPAAAKPENAIPSDTSADAQPAETAPAEAASSLASSGSSTAPAEPPGPAVNAPPAKPEPAEITEGSATGIPEMPVAAPRPQDKSFTLRVTSRLVDVGVVAFDKKGHPVTDLKPGDFDIYDNGRRQVVRSFSGPGVQEQAEALSQQNASPDVPVFSNRRADLDSTSTSTSAMESSVTILLIDTESLAWADLSHAREQMLRFLQSVPAGERVGIYVQSAHGFEVLMEATADHAKVTSALRQWMPTARNLAAAQEKEQRNRQQFDDVSHVEDLQNVNGNINSSPDDATTLDPQLRDFGSNPGRSALAILVSVARHLAATPGRKNLVWVASDNVLVDWTDQAVSSDKGGKHLEGPVLRAQEALNDAHMSVYPLDASQLETQATDASLENRNVQLAPSVTAPPQAQSGGAAPGRITAEMQQDIRPIQGPIRAMAAATGGRVFRRGSDVAANLATVIEDGRAAYLLGFAPDTPADNQYHLITVKLASHRGVVLRYRTGYQYTAEPATPKDRFREAVWQPLDLSDIAVNARPLPAYTGSAFKLNIAINDLALQLQGGRWVDKLDIFVVRRDADGLHSRVTGRTLALALLPSTYQSLLGEGIPFDQFVEKDNNTTSVRFLVVDGNSGRMGSLTIPASAMQTTP